jgi:regulator of protease activity HflC (stomatin/prohibitin superfamily)
VARAKDFQIELDDVAITHLSFSREFTAAIEAKQVAQQDSERAKYVVLQAKQEKVRGTVTLGCCARFFLSLLTVNI